MGYDDGNDDDDDDDDDDDNDDDDDGDDDEDDDDGDCGIHKPASFLAQALCTACHFLCSFFFGHGHSAIQAAVDAVQIPRPGPSKPHSGVDSFGWLRLYLVLSQDQKDSWMR